MRHEGRAGVALLLFQISTNGTGSLSGARHLHSADETQEHAASPAWRRSDNAPRPGVLRLNQLCTKVSEVHLSVPSVSSQRTLRISVISALNFLSDYS